MLILLLIMASVEQRHISVKYLTQYSNVYYVYWDYLNIYCICNIFVIYKVRKNDINIFIFVLFCLICTIATTYSFDIIGTVGYIILYYSKHTLFISSVHVTVCSCMNKRRRCLESKSSENSAAYDV